MTSTTLEFAHNYLDLGWMPIPVPQKSKKPNREDWQNECHTKEDLQRIFTNGVNVGLLNGTPSNNLIDIDLDCRETRFLASYILPPTEMISGRKSAPESHKWYLGDISIETKKFTDPLEKEDRAMMVEFRSTGTQTIVPPSLHPSGERYEWQGQLLPAKVNSKELLSCVRKLASCALIARHWQYGQRENTALALAGTLLRSGWKREEVEEFIRLAAMGANDDEIESRVATVRHTEERLKSGEKTTGLPTLKELLNERVVNKITGWLGLESNLPFNGEAIHSSLEDESIWIDPEPLPDDLLPVPALEKELLPEPFADWNIDIAQRMQCPIDYVAVASLVALSSVVGNQIAIRPKRHDDWAVVCNLYGGIVGRPGVMKTPALDEAIKPLKRLIFEAQKEHELGLANYEIEQLAYEARKKKLKDDITKSVKSGNEIDKEYLRSQVESLMEAEEPHERRHIVNDVTVEQLGVLLNQNPRGLLMFRDELIGWLKTMERDGHQSDRAFYLEAWNGKGSFDYDRIGRGKLHIKTVTLSVLGGIQPGPLSAYLRHALTGAQGDDGLLQRLQMLVYPDVSKTWKNVDRYPDTKAKNRAYEIFKSSDRLDMQSLGAFQDEHGDIPYLRFDEDAQNFFDDWRADLEGELRNGNIEHPAIEAHLSKYRSLMPSLALLFHLIEVADNPNTFSAISFDNATKAAAWCSYLFEHAKRIFGLGLNATARQARSLAEHILSGDLPDTFTARDVYRKHWSGLSSAKEVVEPLTMLEDYGWLRSVTIKSQLEGGRPTTTYILNPKVRGKA